MREDIDLPAVDPAVSRYDTVTQRFVFREPEIGAAMRDEPIQLNERARIEQQVEPLPGREFPLLVLLLNTSSAATVSTLVGFISYLFR